MSERTQPCWLWVDLEMTGLDASSDHILEAAVVITDYKWLELESYETPVYQTPQTLAGMNQWCQKHHRESGLTTRVPHGISEAQLDQRLSQIIDARWQGTPAILCGNSIHQDRKFIDKWLPQTARRLHYRMVDVSTFKVVFQECYGKNFQKAGTHRALDDIRESLSEFRHYLQFIHVGCPVTFPA
jgi:oligoribonuclease